MKLEKKIDSLLDAIVISGNAFDEEYINRIHVEMGSPFSGAYIGTDLTKKLLRTYLMSLFEASKAGDALPSDLSN